VKINGERHYASKASPVAASLSGKAIPTSTPGDPAHRSRFLQAPLTSVGTPAVSDSWREVRKT
jgi:hypothetical protein